MFAQALQAARGSSGHMAMASLPRHVHDRARTLTPWPGTGMARRISNRSGPVPWQLSPPSRVMPPQEEFATHAALASRRVSRRHPQRAFTVTSVSISSNSSPCCRHVHGGLLAAVRGMGGVFDCAAPP